MLRSATIGLTWAGAQRRPAPFNRAWTITWWALSTAPLPIG
jgi:hypothetical protein